MQCSAFISVYSSPLALMVNQHSLVLVFVTGSMLIGRRELLLVMNLPSHIGIVWMIPLIIQVISRCF